MEEDNHPPSRKRGLSGHQGPVSYRSVRHATVDRRLNQAENTILASGIARDELDKKLSKADETILKLVTETDELKEQLKTQKALVRKHRFEAKSWSTGAEAAKLQERIADLEEELLQANDDAKEAWNASTASEKAKRLAVSKHEKETAELLRRAADAEAHEAITRHEVAKLRKLVKDQEQAAKEQSLAHRGRYDVGEKEQTEHACYMERLRAVHALEEFLLAECRGEDSGGNLEDNAKGVLKDFFGKHPEMLHQIALDLRVYHKAEAETVQAIQAHWTLDVCAAMFSHGDLTFAGYQAIINLMCRSYNHNTDSFEDVRLPHGSSMPHLVSKNKLWNYIQSIAEEFGIKSLDNGQAAALDIKAVLLSRLGAIKKAYKDERLPENIRVQLAADAANWRRKPRNSILKNFTAFVVKPLLEIEAKVGVDKENNEVHINRVGEAVNSMHNNRLALLYAGKDCYSLLSKFFNRSDSNRKSILDQLDEIAIEGLDVDGQHIKVTWVGGGDLKFQSEQFGLNGHAGKYPCTHCECLAEFLYLNKEHLRTRHGPLRRTLKRAFMLAHMFGPEWDLTTEYECPGCKKTISADNRHLPKSESATKDFPSQHFGQYPCLPPLLPIEFWQFVPDLLHALLRNVANMYFVTISMNTPNEEKAAEIVAWLERELHVTADAVYNQGNRDSTKKILQSWNGEDCWEVLKRIKDIVSLLHAPGTAEHDKIMGVWEAWTDLYAVLLIKDVPEEKWPELADIVDAKACTWHLKFVRLGAPSDVTPFMHEVVVHFGDFIRLVGPLGPYSSEGVEARHQPIKRTGRNHTNNRGFTAAKTGGNATDIVQTMRRDCLHSHVSNVFPNVRNAKKQTNSDDEDTLSSKLRIFQQATLLRMSP